MYAEEILAIIENLDIEEKEKVLSIIKEKYLMDKLELTRDKFVVGESYQFWLEDDDVYDELID